MMMLHLLWSVPNKHIFLHPENVICRPGHLSGALQCFILTPLGALGRYDFGNISINLAALYSILERACIGRATRCFSAVAEVI